ncbi:MAG: dihydroorotate dehydrogenase electron transfer subunit [Pseudomonadota bacterium]
MIQETGRILHNTKVGSVYYRMGLACSERYEEASPGQFVMIHAGEGDPLLPRPFSIHRLVMSGGRVNGIEILYKVVGIGTQKMSRAGKGDTIRVLGPLGNGFRVMDGVRRVFIIAGGIGVAPLFFLVERILAKGVYPKECHLFLGGKTRKDVLCHDDFDKMGVRIVMTTDDGSAGNQCLVTYPAEMAAGKNPPDMMFACGPAGMLACVAQMAAKLNVFCQVSVEAIMACGIGACMGCAMDGQDPDRYLHVCRDGPVFDSRLLKWGSIHS